MVDLKVNRLQAWTLYEFCMKQAQGAPHGRRMQRLHKAMQISVCEDMFERNEETMDTARKTGKATVPRSWLEQMKPAEPAYSCQIEDGDFEKIWKWTRTWETEKEVGEAKTGSCPECRRPYEVVEDWRIYNPLRDSIEEAHKQIEAQKETSKSDGQAATSSAAPS